MTVEAQRAEPAGQAPPPPGTSPGTRGAPRARRPAPPAALVPPPPGPMLRAARVDEALEALDGVRAQLARTRRSLDVFISRISHVPMSPPVAPGPGPTTAVVPRPAAERAVPDVLRVGVPVRPTTPRAVAAPPLRSPAPVVPGRPPAALAGHVRPRPAAPTGPVGRLPVDAAAGPVERSPDDAAPVLAGRRVDGASSASRRAGSAVTGAVVPARRPGRARGPAPRVRDAAGRGPAGPPSALGAFVLPAAPVAVLQHDDA